MVAIMEQQQGVSQGRRRAEKDPPQGTLEGKSLSKERGRTRLTDILWSGWLKLLLLLCFINSIESAPVGNTPQHVRGGKGGNATLLCEFEARDIIDIILSRQSKKILVSEDEKFGRVFKKGACDIIIKDLRLSDAGKYILSVHYNKDQGEVEREYHLHIQDKISVETGKPLKLDVLLSNAEKVEKNSSEGWKAVWRRGHGVSSDRLTDRDGNLTISNFTVTDTGTYRVLDSEGEILITVTVTGPSKGLVEKIDTDKTEHHKSWIIVVSVIGALLVLVISALIWKYKRQHKNTEHEPVPPEDIELQSRTSRDNTSFCNLSSEPTDPQRIVSMNEFTHEH